MNSTNYGDEFDRLLTRFHSAHIERNVGPKLDHLKQLIQELSSKLAVLDERTSSLDSTCSNLEAVAVKRNETLQSQLESMQADIRHTNGILQQKAATDEVKQLSTALSSMKSQVEQALIDKVATAHFETTSAQLQAESTKLSQLLQSAGERSLRFETTLAGLVKQLSCLEGASRDKASLKDLQQLKIKADRVENQLADMELSLQDKVARTLMKDAVSEMHTQLAAFGQSLSGKVGHEQFQELKATTAMLTKRMATIEQTSHDKVESEQVHQVSTLVSLLQSKVGVLEQLVHDVDEGLTNLAKDKLPSIESSTQAGMSKLHEIEGFITAIGERLQGVEGDLHDRVTVSQMQQLQGIISRLQAEVANNEQMLFEKANCSQIQQLRGVLSGAESKIAELGESLTEKVGPAQMQDIKASLTCFEAKIGSLDGVVQEKVGMGQMQQLKTMVGNLQTQTANIESSVHDKVGSEQLQQMKNQVHGMQVQLTSFDQIVQDKVDASQVHHLKSAVTSIDTKLISIDAAMQDKVTSSQIRQQGDIITMILNKIKGMEQAVWEGMASVEGLERVVSAVKGQATNVEQSMHEKVNADQLQEVSATISNFRTKINTIEQTMRTDQDRINQVEDCLASYGSQFSALKSSLQRDDLSGSRNSVGRLALELSTLTPQVGEKRKSSNVLDSTPCQGDTPSSKLPTPTSTPSSEES